MQLRNLNPEMEIKGMLRLLRRDKMSKKVLVVDDQDMVRNVVVRMVGALGYEAMEAKDGRDGYETTVRELPDLVFSDVDMPEMNGFEMTRKLREDKRTNGIKVVLSSGRDTPEYREQAKSSGADVYLPKPYRLEDLKSTLNNLLGE